MEKAFFMIKSDGVKCGLSHEVLGCIERRGFVSDKLELTRATPELLIEDYTTSGPIVIGDISG